MTVKNPRHKHGYHGNNRECVHCGHGQFVHLNQHCKKWPCECPGFEEGPPWSKSAGFEGAEYRLKRISSGREPE